MSGDRGSSDSSIQFINFGRVGDESFKVTGNSLLIHEFAYTLFIGLCSVTSNMTGYSHSYHLIKLIHCDACIE